MSDQPSSEELLRVQRWAVGEGLADPDEIRLVVRWLSNQLLKLASMQAELDEAEAQLRSKVVTYKEAVKRSATGIVPLHELPQGQLQRPDWECPVPLTEMERLHIFRALDYTGGKKAPAARLLGIDVKTLSNKIKRYGIDL